MNKRLPRDAMSDDPPSLPEFQRQLSDAAECAGYLAELRWPDGWCGYRGMPDVNREAHVIRSTAAARFPAKP